MEKLLKNYFGYDSFKPFQKKVIENVLDKKDSLVLMPTGGGKSLCYQFPALTFPGITLVISPLISLMKDQVDSLNNQGIKAKFINSSLSKKEILKIQNNIHQIKLLYISPERLSSEGFMDFLMNLEVSLIAVDEAHCISQWGHNFRPEYLNLKKLKDFFPKTPIIALTATATEIVKEDILSQLSLKNAKVFVSSFNRENLNLIVLDKKNINAKILHLLKKYRGKSTIIYCFSRRDVEILVSDLDEAGFKVLPYHAGLDSSTRKLHQELFINNQVDIIVATIAFGMGINKPDVRLVIHQTFPKSLEGYYQEIGRAGRDGLESDCILFYSSADLSKHRYFINKLPTFEKRKKELENVRKVMRYCELNSCRRSYVLEHFGENFLGKCSACDVCSPSKKEQIFEGSLALKEKFNSYDKKLFELLKDLRNKLAKKRKIPPHYIFSDVSLIDMAKYFPKDNSAFLKIKGVGKNKLAEYGDLFLKEINNYLNNYLSKSTNLRELDGSLKYLGKTYKQVLEKTSLYDMAISQKLSVSTIVNHICKLFSEGIDLSIDYLLPSEKDVKRIINLFEKFGTEKLAPVYTYLDSEFSYEIIRLVRAKILRS